MSKSPAQQAKEYATKHGFVIEPIRVNGHGKYRVHHNDAPTFERSGYPAVLREMTAIVNCSGPKIEEISDADVPEEVRVEQSEITCEHDFVREDNICAECGTVVRSAPGQPYGVYEPISDDAALSQKCKDEIFTLQRELQQNYKPPRDFPIVSYVQRANTHVLRYKVPGDDHIYSAGRSSYAEALKLLRRQMSNPATRPTWCVIESIRIEA